MEPVQQGVGGIRSLPLQQQIQQTKRASVEHEIGQFENRDERRAGFASIQAQSSNS